MSSSSTEAGLVEVAMPQMGVSMADGTIAEWRKQPGDWVEADETVCDVTTDKIDVEIPSPATGRLARHLAEVGETVEVGTPIAEIDPAAKPGEAHPDEHNGAARRAEAVKEEVDRSSFYSPVVRRIADKHGVDLERIEGTGVGRRVRKKDVLAQVGNGESAGEAERPLHTESPYQAEPAREAEPAHQPEARPTHAAPEHRERMSPMRRAIAKHMVESRRTAAHCTTVVEVDLSGVVARRAELREALRRRGVNLTYLAFVAEATVAALAEFPILNASVDGDEIVNHDDVNLGIAVALEDGLVVPVIHRAQRLSLEGLAAAIGDLAARAREKRLEPDDVHGGTFTITNPGQFGAVLATPIINQPQAAILDLEAVVKRPVVVESDDDDAIAIRPMTNLCMSWDHRALDGMVAARFLGSVKDRLEGYGSDR